MKTQFYRRMLVLSSGLLLMNCTTSKAQSTKAHQLSIQEIEALEAAPAKIRPDAQTLQLTQNLVLLQSRALSIQTDSFETEKLSAEEAYSVEELQSLLIEKGATTAENDLSFAVERPFSYENTAFVKRSSFNITVLTGISFTVDNLKLAGTKVFHVKEQTSVGTTPQDTKYLLQNDYFLIYDKTAYLATVTYASFIRDGINYKNKTITLSPGLKRQLSSVISANPGFTLSPNPSDGRLTITTDGSFNGNLPVSIYDVSGRLLKQVTIIVPANQGYSGALDCTDLASGTYILKIQSGTTSLSATFTINK